MQPYDLLNYLEQIKNNFFCLLSSPPPKKKQVFFLPPETWSQLTAFNEIWCE